MKKLLFLLIFCGNLSASSCEEFTCDITSAQQKDIYEMISIIGSTPTALLLFKMGRINQLRGQLKEVLPLQFFAYIFSTPALVKEMVKIRSNSAKYNPFVSGSKKALYQQYKNGYLEKQIEGFALYLKLDPSEVKRITLTAAKSCSNQEKDACFLPFFNYLIAHTK